MKVLHLILTLAIASGLTHAAEDYPDLSHWKEDFSDEAAFLKNWSSYGWLPDGKVVSGPENMHRWWQIHGSELRGQTFGKLHASGLTRKVSGTDVRLRLRFKLEMGGMAAVGFNGPNPILEANFHLAGFHIRPSSITAWDEENLQPKDAHRNYICEPDADPKRTFSVTRRAIAFMERQAQEKNPFYLKVSYYAIHTAYQARQATLAKYAGKGEPPRQLNAGIAPMLEDLDTGVGQLLEAIDRLGIGENTYVFFTSDNGGSPEKTSTPQQKALPLRNHPLRQYKQYLYEGGIRVPFIVRGPGVQPNTICREPVAQYDLLPTFYELAGARDPLPDEIDGGSLRPLLLNAGQGEVKRPLPGLVFHRPLLKPQPHSAIRMGDFKLVINWSGPWQIARRELFNLAKDIGEQQNLAEAMPGKADEMSAALIAYLKSVNAETAVAATPKKK
jgi:hypothetical protein